MILALLLSGCVSPSYWCEGDIEAETWEAQLDLVLENCAPMLRLSLPSYVAPVEGDD